MSIGKSIKQLLEERNRVILPGFGNLEVKEAGSSVPAQGKRIDPPGLSVKFDSSFSKDDGTLASAFSRNTGIEKEEAEQQVLELVDAIRFALDKGETYPLDKAGVFSRDDEGKIHFQIDPSWVIEPEQYGLDSMDLLELEDLPGDDKEPTVGDPEAEGKETEIKDEASAEEEFGPEEKPEEKREEKPEEAAGTKPEKEPGAKAEEAAVEKAEEAAVEKAEEAAEEKPVVPQEKPVMRVAARPEPIPQPKAHEPWKNKKTKKRSGLWRIIWIVTGILIVALVILLVVPAERWDREGKNDIPGYVKQSEQPTQSPGVSDQSAADNEGAGESSISEQGEVPAEETASETASETKPEVKTQPAQSHDFFIIAGSFSHLKNASELQDRLKAMGYPAEVMVTENRMYRVSVDSYASKEEAEASLVRIQSEPGMESCWLLSNE